MHNLEMPLALAGLQIDANQAFAEQIVARPLSAVVVGRRRFHRKINQPEFFIDGHLSPHAGVAVGGPGTVLPGFVAELARPWNGVERPQQLAGFNIKSPHQALGVVMRDDGHALFEG